MTMPPSGVSGIMDEEAVIEAEIRFELDNINLDAGDDALEPVELEHLEEDPGTAGPQDTEDASEEFDAYLRRIQEQTSRFEQELEECDDVLNHSTSVNTAPPSSGALVLYDDHQLLAQLAQESGCDVEAYKQKILDEIENDEDIIVDELTDLMVPESSMFNNDEPSDERLALEGSEPRLQIREAGESDKGLLQGPGGEPGQVIDHNRDKISTNIQRAVEEGMDPEDTPVCQAVVPLDGPSRQPTSSHIDIQKVLREQLDKLEQRYDERIDKVKKDQAFRRNEEDLREQRLNEERQWKKQEYEREQQRLTLERELAEKRMEKDREEAERQMQAEMRQFESEMRLLQEEMERQQKDHQMSVKQEEDRQRHIQQQAATRVQKIYRGYRVRKQYGPELDERREMRLKEREEERIKEIEIVIEKRNTEKKEQEEKEKERKEEEKRKLEEQMALKEEEKRQKQLEKKQKEEEKRRQKEEEERIKQEEKRRKEEEKKRKKEEEKQRKEEEKRRKEEEKKRKLEEEQRKKEEKKLKEEEDKRKKEEEKQRKIEEEKLKEQEEENLKMIEVVKTKGDLKNEDEIENQQQKNQMEIENKKNEEKLINSDEKHNLLTENESKANKAAESITVSDENKVTQTADAVKPTAVTAESNGNLNPSKTKDSSLGHSVTDTNNSQSLPISMTLDSSVGKIRKAEGEASTALGEVKVGSRSSVEPARTKTPRSARTPRPPTPHKAKEAEAKDKTTGGTTQRAEDSPEKAALEKVDCLPEPLEALRIGFIKDCLPWGKVSNEPWKLKSGSTRKPVRRPSSAKKLPLLTDSIILQAGRVASLKQVTTVELTDLPGNNVSSLGQCTGLKYLVMTRCNLLALDGLAQCLQLQYLDVHDNKLEYMDVKNHGQLQYVNASHNRLSSIHGLDNCTNLRWLDFSHNNITRIGGLETLRRLHTLKLSHNQLISTHGLGDTPTLQMIDISHNHLQAVEDLHKLCLLVTLDLSANTLLKVPELQNQILLLELLVNDNNISSVEELSKPWLPLLHTIHLGQNSIDDLSSLANCLLLRHLDVSNNQLLDAEIINKCVSGCFYLEQLNVEENPVEQDINESFYTKLKQTGCPRLLSPSGSQSNIPPLKPRTSFETMCLTQDHTLKDVFTQFEASIRSVQTGKSAGDPALLCDMYLKHCEKTFNLAVEYRYAHEYGEVTVTMPTAPTMPKSGRPLSARQKEKFVNPKDLFENALKSSNTKTTQQPNVDTYSSPKDLFENALRSSNNKMTPQTVTDTSAAPKDQFENALKSSNVNSTNPKDLFEAALNPSNQVSSSVQSVASTNNAEFSGMSTTGDVKSAKDLFSAAVKDTEKNGVNGHGSDQPFTNGVAETVGTGKQASEIVSSSTAMNNSIVEHSSPMAIKPGWQGNSTHKIQNGELDVWQESDGLEHLHESAVKIQAIWRGYILRKKLMAALEYAQCDFEEEEDDDAMDFGGEFDLDKFVDIDQDLIDTDWRPPTTPDIPKHHPVLGKPPTGHQPVVPPISVGDLRPPSNPRRAWKNFESPISDYGKIPRPPSSVASTSLTARSKKEEKLSEEWGFRDTNTAHLMMQRAKKMKYNAERRKKISKLDPKQRLALFRRLEEVIPPEHQYVPQRKVLPRKEYFQARQDEIYREEQEKKEVIHTRASRTFEWLHTQVGDHNTTDSIINQGLTSGPKYIPEGNLPELQGGRRVQLVSSPGSIELQSVGSASSAGHKARRFSAGSGQSIGKLPPIQNTSAPTDHVKERMSFRNPKVNQSVGWGGGKKRGGSGT